jgi:hypothetical protein
MIVCWNLKLRDDTIVANKNFPGVYAFRFACSHCSQIEFISNIKRRSFSSIPTQKNSTSRDRCHCEYLFQPAQKGIQRYRQTEHFRNLMDALRHKVETLEQLLPKDY